MGIPGARDGNTLQRHTLVVTSKVRDSPQPRAASLIEELKENGGSVYLSCGAGDAALVCL